MLPRWRHHPNTRVAAAALCLSPSSKLCRGAGAGAGAGAAGAVPPLAHHRGGAGAAGAVPPLAHHRGGAGVAVGAAVRLDRIDALGRECRASGATAHGLVASGWRSGGSRSVCVSPKASRSRRRGRSVADEHNTQDNKRAIHFCMSEAGQARRNSGSPSELWCISQRGVARQRNPRGTGRDGAWAGAEPEGCCTAE